MALALSRNDEALFLAPANRIPADCTALTPDMLPLVELTPAQLERIVSAVPGSAANVQDIYPWPRCNRASCSTICSGMKATPTWCAR
ncbi:hypothetical protein THH46_17360 [Pseudomonas sp. NA13]